jgi:death-on-curing protein
VEPIWLTRHAVDAMQETLRQQFGGNAGILNDGSIESALARPRNRHAYDGGTLFQCAAAYVFGLAKNHGYQDSNKRIAYMAGITFLDMNGHHVRAPQEAIIALMLDVAQDVVTEDGIAAWLEAHTVDDRDA